jgi:uncharacterized protein
VTNTGSAGRSWLAVFAAMTLLLTLLHPIDATADDAGTTATGAGVVISQVYGGGGNSGAPYTHDYVELFNRGDADATLSGLSVQYASATGTGNFGANSGQLTELPNVTLKPGEYFLIQQAGGATGAPLPAPDLVDATPIAMAAGAGKVALVVGVTSLGCNGSSGQPCNVEQLGRIIDLVGYGSANFFEGTAAAPTLSNTTAALRAGDGCTDTDDNAADFTSSAPGPRNTSSPRNPCGGTLGPIPVISQVYGGGGNSGAQFTHDFVEIFNRGDAPVDLDGLSIQYASATGAGNFGANSGQLTELPAVTLQPGQYYLVQQAAGAGNGVPLPAPDLVDPTPIAMAAGAGKVALAEGTTSLGCNGGSTPCSAEQLKRIIDLVGYGNANFFEGSAAAPTLTNTTAALRADDGCTDTDDNAADFTAPAPAPRNTSSPRNPCGGEQPPVNQPVVASCTDLDVVQGDSGSVQLTATDEDGTVVDATITNGQTEGIALANASPASEVGGTFSVDLTASDLLAAGAYPVDVTFSNDDPEPQQDTCTVTVTVNPDVCEVSDEGLTPINEIQGSGSATPLAGETVVTRGVVTTAFPSGGATGLPNSHGLRGFFVEAVEADRDDDPQTSEGLFVFDFAGLYDAELGDLVYVEGTPNESFGLTQVSSNNFSVCDGAEVDATLPPPAELPLPVAPADRAELLEPFESMRVTYDELTLVEFFQLERFGDVRVSSGGIFDNPTNVVSPYDDEAYNEIVAFNAANNIILSSGRTAQNIDRPGPEGTPPLPFVEPGDTLRIGDQLIDQSFVLHFSFNNWRLQPIDIDELSEQFQKNRTRERPLTPPEVGGSLTVASYNVLNYFNGDGQGGGFPTARGARNQAELDRQTEKLVAAVTEIDADIVGLIEMENDGGEYQATWTFVEALNEAYGEEVYDFVDTGVIGGDAIKQAFIYKPATVEATGDYALLDSAVDPRFDDTRSRPALAQTFTELATGEAITVTVNHLKSKGSGCGGPPNDDPRQGNCNGTRTEAAKAIADWMNDDPTGQEAVGSLIIGDINAYAEEDPITEIVERGYVDMLKVFAPEGGPVPYSYTFDATQGRLDHALADEDLAPFVTGADEWHINADETQAIDYQLSGPGSFRTAAVAEQYYQPNAFRSSDHDPVIIGLDLRPFPPTDEEQCKNGGWRIDYRGASFRNQGQCVAYVVANPRAGFPR